MKKKIEKSKEGKGIMEKAVERVIKRLVVPEFERVDKRLTRIEMRLDTHDEKFGEIIAKLNEHDEKFNEIIGHIDHIYRELEERKQEYLFIREALKRIEEGMEDKGKRLEEVEKSVTTLKQEVTRLQHQVDQLDAQVAEMKG